MKKIALLLLMFLVLTSFTSVKPIKQGFPCHPAGDLYRCSHPMHVFGDLGPCCHTYFDGFGNLRYVHMNGDLYPCTHPMHPLGDIGPCTHICF